MSELLSTTLRVPVTPSMKADLERIAKREDVTVAWIARSACKKLIAADKQRRAK